MKQPFIFCPLDQGFIITLFKNIEEFSIKSDAKKEAFGKFSGCDHKYPTDFDFIMTKYVI